MWLVALQVLLYSFNLFNYFFFITVVNDLNSFLPGRSAGLFTSYYLCLFNNYLLLSLFNSIRLYLSSFDVIHSFGIHSLGIKSDAIPGRLNYLSNILLFNVGSFSGYCFELCGLAHTSMLISLFSMSSFYYSSFILSFITHIQMLILCLMFSL